MKFADILAEDYYKKLCEELGVLHVNTGGKEITLETLKSLKDYVQNIKEE